VEELLGLGHGDRWLELVKHLLMGNTSAALGVINQAAWDGTDLRQLHRQAQDLLRAALILEWGAADTLDLPDHVTGQIQELVSQMPSWRIIKALKIWGDVNMRYDAPSTLPLELAVVEICNEEAAPPVAAAPAPAAQRGSAPPVAGAQRREVAPPPSRPSAASAGAPPAPIAGAAPAAEPDPDQDLRSRWIAAVKALGRCKGKKYNLGALLRDCKSETVSLEGDTLTLPFTHRTNMERMQEELEDPNGRKMLSDAIEKFFGQAYGVRMTLISDNGEAGSGRSTQQSPLVRTALGMGARIVEEYSE
jgi:DNA polymerase III gamma/tau subunit